MVFAEELKYINAWIFLVQAGFFQEEKKKEKKIYDLDCVFGVLSSFLAANTQGRTGVCHYDSAW